MNKLDQKLLDILVCPVSKKALVQIDQELVCARKWFSLSH